MQETRPGSDPPKTFGDLPLELVKSILREASQDTLSNFSKTCRSAYNIAKPFLYHNPQFASMYRFALFAHTVGVHKHLAKLVMILDLSGLCDETVKNYVQNDQNKARAKNLGSLLNWKKVNGYQTTWVSFLALVEGISVPDQKDLQALHKHFHDFGIALELSRVSVYRNLSQKMIPVGALCHVLRACQNLEVVNFSRLHSTFNYSVENIIRTPSAPHYDAQCFNILNVNDELINLPKLKTFISDSICTVLAYGLVSRSKSLQNVDFTGAVYFMGEEAWKKKGTSKEIRNIIRDMLVKEASYANQLQKATNQL